MYQKSYHFIATDGNIGSFVLLMFDPGSIQSCNYSRRHPSQQCKVLPWFLCLIRKVGLLYEVEHPKREEATRHVLETTISLISGQTKWKSRSSCHSWVLNLEALYLQNNKFLHKCSELATISRAWSRTVIRSWQKEKNCPGLLLYPSSSPLIPDPFVARKKKKWPEKVQA